MAARPVRTLNPVRGHFHTIYTNSGESANSWVSIPKWWVCVKHCNSILVFLFATKTSNTADLVLTVVLFHFNTVRHVKCVRKMRWEGMCLYGEGELMQTGGGAKT